jgi:DNA-binding response OmpR family regulator
VILLVERDPRRAEPIARELSRDGYDVRRALSAGHARALVQNQTPAVVLLGALEGANGSLALLREIRAAEGPWDPQLAALVLGRGADELALLRAFDAGADEFLPVADRHLELRARLRALLRRTAASGSARVLRVGELSVDAVSRRARLGRRELALRRMEFELLAHMARDPERVCGREELLHAVWRYGAGVRTRTVDTHASRLRRELDPPARGTWVICVRGVGYRLI